MAKYVVFDDGDISDEMNSLEVAMNHANDIMSIYRQDAYRNGEWHNGVESVFVAKIISRSIENIVVGDEEDYSHYVMSEIVDNVGE